MAILLLDDWRKYPTAIVDTQTKNKTFLDLAAKYKAMGIKNYFFHLALIQPELQGIDPFDPTLSVEIMTKIILECKINPWYFFREVFRLPTQGGIMPDPLRANRGNIGTYWLFFNHIDVALVQPRQTGKSVGADGIDTYVVQVAGVQTAFSLITKDHDLRKKNIQRLKDMRDALPAYLNPYQKNIDENNQYGLTAKSLGNSVTTGVAQADEPGAINLGRGSTNPCAQIDEGPFCKNIHYTIPAFLSSGNAARDNAARHGGFYGNIFTTTAGKLDTPEGKYMFDLFSQGMSFDERKLFDCSNPREVYQVVQNGSKDKPLVYVCLSHRQLGYTDEWLYKKMAESASKGDDADRDYMNIWTVGSLRNPLEQHILNAIKASKVDSSYMEMTDEMYCIDWYIDKDKIDSYLRDNVTVLGNDMSKAVGKDSITMYLMDTETLETIFTVVVNETNVSRFIEWFCKLMLKYNRIVVNPEHQQTGIVLIDTLLETLVLHGINPFKRIYNTIVDDGLHLTNPEFAFIHRDPYSWPQYALDKYKKHFGFTTSGSGRHSRQSLYKTITRLAELTATNIKNDQLITEIGGLVVKGDRIDHACSGHDDMVIAWLLAGWMLLNTRNLDFYGITNPAGRAKAFNKVEKEVKPLTAWEKVQAKEQERLVSEVKSLLARLEQSDDYFEIDCLETQIRAYSEGIVSDKYESNTVTDLIRNAKEARAKGLMERRNDYSFNQRYY